MPIQDAGESFEELVTRAKAARHEGQPRLALAFYLEAAGRAREAGAETPAWAHALRHAAELQRQQGDLTSAVANARDVVRFYRERGAAPLEMANALRVLALAEQARGEDEAARSSWTEARQLYEEAGVEAGVHEADTRLGSIGLH